MPELLTEPAGVWQHTAPGGEWFTIRQAASLDDLEQCIALQQQTWGYSDLEVVPRNIYVLAQALGGHVLCAFTEQAGFAGFAMAIAAHAPAPGSPGSERWMRSIRPDPPRLAEHGERSAAPAPYLHSHLVAIAAEYRSSGLGSALKFAQRDLALAAGIDIMRWTFDPMMARNAAFNLNRLGAVVRRYIPDFYGTLTSVLQGGLPTDRFLAEWELDGARARGALQGAVPATAVVETIELSPEVPAWKAAGARAPLEAAQRHLRLQFTDAFARGLRLVGFAPDGRGGGAYQLAPPGSFSQ